ncbi:hypothetical protein WDW89_09400 [Deltaproteobacteria bacterium TL4]
MSEFQELETFFVRQGARFCEVGGLSVLGEYASGMAAELQYLLQGVGILVRHTDDLIEMCGPEARSFLQGMVTNDINQLEVGGVQSNLICGNKGKIRYRLEVFRKQKEVFLLLCEPNQGRQVGGYLDHFHIREDFQLKLLNPELLRCDWLGPQAENLLRELGYQPQQNSWEWNGHSLLSIPFPLGAHLRMVNLLPQAAYVALIETVLNQPAKVGMLGEEAYEQIRVDVGIPRFGVDFVAGYFPQEAALMDHISYNKGCYVGQETHARMYHRGHPNHQLTGLKVPLDKQVQAGGALFHEQQEAGKICSISGIEHEDGFRGIAFLRYPVVQENVPLSTEPEGTPLIHTFPLVTNRKQKLK